MQQPYRVRAEVPQEPKAAVTKLSLRTRLLRQPWVPGLLTTLIPSILVGFLFQLGKWTYKPNAPEGDFFGGAPTFVNFFLRGVLFFVLAIAALVGIAMLSHALVGLHKKIHQSFLRYVAHNLSEGEIEALSPEEADILYLASYDGRVHRMTTAEVKRRKAEQERKQEWQEQEYQASLTKSPFRMLLEYHADMLNKIEKTDPQEEAVAKTWDPLEEELALEAEKKQET